MVFKKGDKSKTGFLFGEFRDLMVLRHAPGRPYPGKLTERVLRNDRPSGYDIKNDIQLKQQPKPGPNPNRPIRRYLNREMLPLSRRLVGCSDPPRPTAGRFQGI